MFAGGKEWGSQARRIAIAASGMRCYLYIDRWLFLGRDMIDIKSRAGSGIFFHPLPAVPQRSPRSLPPIPTPPRSVARHNSRQLRNGSRPAASTLSARYR